MLSHAFHASFSDSADLRVSDRRLLRLEARVATPSGEGGMQVHNLSRTGMLVECGAEVPVGTSIEVELPGGARHRAEVMWTDEALFGCRFVKPLSQAVLSAALLRSAPPPPEAPSSLSLTQDQALAKLHEHWDLEADASSPDEKKMSPGARMWVIGGFALAGWAMPAAAAYMLG